MSGPRVLVVRFSAIGDCVMAAWAATALRERHPDAEIEWAVDVRCADVVEVGRLASRRIEFARDAWKRKRWSPATWRSQLATYAKLRGRGYDLGFDLQGHSKTALCLMLARPKRRASAFATDGLARRFCPPIGRKPDDVHQVDWLIQTVASLEPVSAPVRPIMPAVGDNPFREGGRSFVSIAVGAGHLRKTVPAATWVAVGAALRDAGWTVAYFGGPEVEFAAPEGTRNLVGKTTLSEWNLATATSDLVLAGDTGAGHIASAYGVPVVSVFGPTDPRTYRPYGDRVTVIQGLDASAGQIVEAARGLTEGVWQNGS